MVRRIKEEPVITKALIERKVAFPRLRPFRDDILVRLEVIEKNIRDPEFFGNVAASTVLGRLFAKVPAVLPGIAGQELLERRTRII